MNNIVPLILAGGSWTRLWPVSRKSFPKQFSPLFGEKTLFQKNAIRLTTSEKVSLKPQITITNSDFRFIVKEQLEEIDKNLGTILIEPLGKTQGPLFLQVLWLQNRCTKTQFFWSPRRTILFLIRFLS